MSVLVYLNKVPFLVSSHITILQACRENKIDIPHFCFHEDLPVSVIAGCVWLKLVVIINL